MRIFPLAALATLAAACLPAGHATAQPVVNLGPGQTSAGDFEEGATVNVNGGTILSTGFFGGGASLTNGVININSGTVGDGFTSINSIVNLSGGTVGEFIASEANTAGEAGEVNISGGTIGSFGLFDGVTSTITGGSVLRFPDVFAGSTVNIFGGDLFSLRLVNQTATANFFGSGFALDGVPINLAFGQTINITPGTGQNFSATLADGSPFEFDLNTFGAFSGPNPDQTVIGSIITATLTAISGDANADGAVNAADFVAFRDTLGAGAEDPLQPFAGADNTGDGVVTTADFGVFLDRFGATGGPAAAPALSVLATPEPTAAALAALTLLAPLSRRR